MDTVRINDKDNVCVVLSTGHKAALRDIAKGEPVVKYGFPIGYATRDISAGERVHTDNMKTGLGALLDYEYAPKFEWPEPGEPFMIDAYVRANGDIGIRNDVWIVPTVGCVNGIGKQLAQQTGALFFAHPYGCSQLGGDERITQLILRGLIRHPNAGGVLVLGLGCENNNISRMQEILGGWDERRVRFLNTQDVEDEMEEGRRIIAELQAIAAEDKRQRVPASKLKIGMKCGGSDGFSGITANPVVGLVCDALCAMGASAVLTEVPEMFGAETVLFERCVSREVFGKGVKLINDFKEYFRSHGEPVSENPSPGNKEGGITTLEEKSLGCVQKGGSAPVVDVLDYGDTVQKSGLHLLNGPGNDIVSITNLTAAGCHMVLFTTGRGTPLGGAVPTVKIGTNNAISAQKKHWIDFNAYGLENRAEIAGELLSYIGRVASGEMTNNEKSGCREIAIFKDGVTL